MNSTKIRTSTNSAMDLSKTFLFIPMSIFSVGSIFFSNKRILKRYLSVLILFICCVQKNKANKNAFFRWKIEKNSVVRKFWLNCQQWRFSITIIRITTMSTVIWNIQWFTIFCSTKNKSFLSSFWIK